MHAAHVEFQGYGLSLLCLILKNVSEIRQKIGHHTSKKLEAGSLFLAWKKIPGGTLHASLEAYTLPQIFPGFIASDPETSGKNRFVVFIRLHPASVALYDGYSARGIMFLFLTIRSFSEVAPRYCGPRLFP
jgi:hypothetical protein